MTDPAQQIAPASPELMRAVASTYRQRRQAGALEHEAWEAARDVVLERRSDLGRPEAGIMATRIIAWAAQQHGGWF